MKDEGYTFTIRLKTIGLWLVCSPAVVLPLMWLWSLPWDSPNTPAWVQAFGSITAILVAVYIAGYQHRKDEVRRRAEKKEQEVGFSMRLYLLAREYTTLITEVVSHEAQLANVESDRRHSIIFNRLLTRLNANFDGDVDPGRNMEAYQLRVALTGTVFLLEATDGIRTNESRERGVLEFRRIGEELLNSCFQLVQRARNN